MRFPFTLQRRAIMFASIALITLFMTTPSLASSNLTVNSSGPRTWHVTLAFESGNHAIQGMAFLPNQIWVDVGDTITWTVKAGDIHTVTFLPPGTVLPPFTGAPNQVNRVGGSVYDGVHYYNSGLMSSFPGVAPYLTYSLKFSMMGDYTYYCLVHPGMIGVVHVMPAGSPYPYSQWDYFSQSQMTISAGLRDGQNLSEWAQDHSNSHHVTVGIGDGLVGVMRFFPQSVTIDVGDTIVFTSREPMDPHTVTYGTLTTNDFFPVGNPNAFDGSKPLNSGFIGSNPGWFGTVFTVKFIKAGTYKFRCDLHDYLGMLLTITVKP